MVPVVLTELLSDSKLPTGVAETLSEVPLIEIGSGYCEEENWETETNWRPTSRVRPVQVEGQHPRQVRYALSSRDQSRALVTGRGWAFPWRAFRQYGLAKIDSRGEGQENILISSVPFDAVALFSVSACRLRIGNGVRRHKKNVLLIAMLTWVKATFAPRIRTQSYQL
jgi:hypothetical protein